MVLTIPPSDGRYQLVAFLDMWSNNFAAVSTLDEMDTDEGTTFVIAWEGWEGEVPNSSMRFDSPTPRVWMLIRTLVLGDDDIPNGDTIQDAMTLEPLTLPSSLVPEDESECPVLSPPDVLLCMTGDKFQPALSAHGGAGCSSARR